jgi:sodium-dependent dicarboxylate transporter 2/3/5
VYIAVPVGKDKNDFKPEIIKEEVNTLGAMSKAEKLTLVLFVITGVLWLLRSDINLGSIKITGWASFLGLQGYVHDSTVAIFMAILTFILPSGEEQDGKMQMLMNWNWVRKVPWGILLLFGGGFALANGFQESGLTQWLGGQLKTFDFLPLVLMILVVSALSTFTTEFASNTAMASTLLPILAGLSLALEINPMILMIPATISCSTAFMLPVATPPNAIVFGSGYIRIKNMVKIGLIMNLVGLLLILLFVYLLAEPIFGINGEQVPAWVN